MILCLPDEASREAVSLIENEAVKVIDASTAFRVAEGWTYGFAEMSKTQRAKIAAATRISNPGCYPTGFIALVRPLIEVGLVPRGWQFFCNAVSGYSGGGKAMIAEFEDEAAPGYTRAPYRIMRWRKSTSTCRKCRCRPAFRARDLRAERGALLQGHDRRGSAGADGAAEGPKLADVHGALADAYAGERFVRVASLDEAAALKTLVPKGSMAQMSSSFSCSAMMAKRGWLRCSTISARARAGLRCKTSIWRWGWTRARGFRAGARRGTARECLGDRFRRS